MRRRPDIKKRLNAGLRLFGLATPFLWGALFLLMLSASGCRIDFSGSRKNKEKKNIAAPVVIQPVARGDISSHLRLNAAVEPEREVEIFARTVGTVIRLFVEEGDRVGNGKLLAKLDDSEQKLALEKASAALSRQRAELARAEELFQRRMISEDEFERVRLALRDAELNVKQAELALEYTSIAAPFPGTIAERKVELGERMNLGKSLFRLVDSDTLLLNCWAGEAELASLNPGTRVEVTAQAFLGERFTAQLVRISPVVDPGTGKTKVTFTLIDNRGKLKPGQFVELRVTLATHRHALLIPKRSLVWEAGSPVVYLKMDSLAVRRPVMLGLETGSTVEILSGLTDGDTVVVEGQTTLKDSSLVRVVDLVG